MRKLGSTGGAVLALLVTATALAAGSGWKVQRSPNPKGAKQTYLNAVSCPSAGQCMAVGYATKNLSVYTTLAERRQGGKWSLEHMPNPGGSYDNLHAVSCPSAKRCVAVGDYATGGTDVMLIERWNGKRWSVANGVTPAGATGSGLTGVSCTSSKACTAVGEYEKAGVGQTLVEHWNGRKWSIEHTPNPPGGSQNQLEGVSCVSQSACMAVGYYDNSSHVEVTLAEGWNGKKWSIRHTANPAGAQYAELGGVSCSSAGACTAAGSYQKTPEHARTLAERWNGKKWRIQQTPNPTSDPNHFLYGVSCTAANDCTAAGYTEGSVIWDATLVEHWHGSKWTVQHASNPGSDNSLSGLSCSATSACTAVGWYQKNSSAPVKTLIEHR